MRRNLCLIVVTAVLLGAGLLAAPARATPAIYNGKIAFTRAANTNGDQVVASVNPDGTGAVNLTPATYGLWPSFRGDGTALSYVDTTTSSLTTVAPDGTNRHALFHWSTAAGSAPRWSPDGSRFVWQGAESGSNPIPTVHLIDADGTHLQTLFGGDSIVEGSPSWFGNDQIVFITFTDNKHNSIGVANADGTGRATLFSGASGLSHAERNADGSALVFAWWNGQSSRIVVANGDGSNAHLVGPTESADPTFSPDGTQIAFARNYPNQGIWTMYLDGTKLHRVTAGMDQSPTWGRGTTQPNIAPFAYGSVKNSASLAAFANAAASYDEDGTIASYEWRWGDYTAMATSKYAWHRYAAAGTYLVRLTVTDNDGARATRQAWIQIS